MLPAHNTIKSWRHEAAILVKMLLKLVQQRAQYISCCSAGHSIKQYANIPRVEQQYPSHEDHTLAHTDT